MRSSMPRGAAAGPIITYPRCAGAEGAAVDPASGRGRRRARPAGPPSPPAYAGNGGLCRRAQARRMCYCRMDDRMGLMWIRRGCKATPPAAGRPRLFRCTVYTVSATRTLSANTGTPTPARWTTSPRLRQWCPRWPCTWLGLRSAALPRPKESCTSCARSPRYGHAPAPAAPWLAVPECHRGIPEHPEGHGDKALPVQGVQGPSRTAMDYASTMRRGLACTFLYRIPGGAAGGCKP